MPDAAVTPDLTLVEGQLSLEVLLRPFGFTLRRAGRRLLRNASAWVAEGTASDHFVQWTEGVVANEQLGPHERITRVTVEEHSATTVHAAVVFEGGRRGRLTLALHPDERFTASLTAAGEPLRLALEWDRRTVEHFVGLGARHGNEFDQRGRAVQLGADRRYTGPDCPPEMLTEGGIPQGDCAPAPWMLSSRGYGVLAHTFANGTRFDMSSDRTSVSVRAAAGPLELEFFCQGRPVARLRALCRATGFPALLPEWAYGYWKSRDVHEDRITAVALVIFARWDPMLCLWASLAFGGAAALGPALQSVGVTSGYHLFNAAPYILTLAIMIITCSPKRTLTGAPAELSINR